MSSTEIVAVTLIRAACELIAGGDPDGAELVLWTAVENLENAESHRELVH